MKRLVWIFVAVLMAASVSTSQLVLATTQSPTADEGMAQTDTFSVTVLIVDEFDTDEQVLTDEDTPEDSLCALSPVEQGFAIRGAGFAIRGAGFAIRGADAEEEDEEVLAHGEIVRQQIEDSLEALSADDLDITLVNVDIDNGPDSDALTTIEEALEDASDADFVVINMSISFVPCEFLEALSTFDGSLSEAAAPGSPFRSLFQRANIEYNDEKFSVNSNTYSDPSNTFHPLQTLLNDNSSNTVAISAAGNFGLDYPFWPAAFPQVLSVAGSNDADFISSEAWDQGGQDGDAPLLSEDGQGQGNNSGRISNYGEVMLGGEYEVAEDSFIIGTSFAAPRMTAVVAVYLANVGSDFCTNDDGFLALNTGDYDNALLTDSVSDNCSDMSDYLP